MIYFAQSTEIAGGPIKIGYSENVVRRIEQLAWNYKTPMALLATMPGGPDEERAIHARFSHLRLGRTEQFQPAAELLVFIGRPLLVSADPDAVEAMPSPMRSIVSLKGSPELEEWLDDLVKASESGTRANALRRALRAFAQEQGVKEPIPER